MLIWTADSQTPDGEPIHIGFALAEVCSLQVLSFIAYMWLLAKKTEKNTDQKFM